VSIGTSKGAFYKTPLDLASGFRGDDAMVVSPDKADTNKKLEELELSIDGFGLPVSFRMPLESPTEPADALKSTGGTKVASEVPQEEIDWSQLNKPFGSLKSTSKEDTPVVAKAAGGLITITEGDIKEATDMAGNFMGTMAGVKSKLVDKPSLYLAMDAHRQGIHQDEVFKGTGWFKGADDMWRYEIDDSKAVLNEKWADNPSSTQKQLGYKTAKLPEVLDHPELYEAYPQLKDYQIIYDNNYQGIAEFSGKAIKVGKNVWTGSSVPAYKDKSIIMHEIQHAIQDIEGFAKGGAPGRTNRDFALKYEEAVEKLRPEMFVLRGMEAEGAFLTAPQQARLDYLKTVFKKYTEYTKGADVEARSNYIALAGETEARNVQHRIDLTPQERMKHNPLDTEDVARGRQITRKDSSLTTPYFVDGDFLTYGDPMAKGQVQKAEGPTPFRRSANDNKTYKQLTDELDELVSKDRSLMSLTDDEYQRVLDLNKILTGLEKNPPKPKK
jgi:hypothetical protein